MHAMSLIQTPIKSFTLEKGMKMCMSFKFDEIMINNQSCLIANDVNDNWLWYRRLRHASMKTLSKIIKNDLVIGLPKLIFDKDKICDACQFGKQVRNSFKSKNLISTFKPLELLHVDLFGPMDVLSMGGKSYGLSSLMIILGSLGFIFLHIKMKHYIHS